MNNIETIEEIVEALKDIESNQTYNKVAELINNIEKNAVAFDLTYRDKYLNLATDYEELSDKYDELQEWSQEQEEEILQLKEDDLI